LRSLFAQFYGRGEEVFRFLYRQIRCRGGGRIYGFEMGQRLAGLDSNRLMCPMVVNRGSGIGLFIRVTTKVENNTIAHKWLDFFIVYYILERFKNSRGIGLQAYIPTSELFHIFTILSISFFLCHGFL